MTIRMICMITAICKNYMVIVRLQCRTQFALIPPIHSSATHPTPYVVRGVGSRQAPIQHAKNLSQGKYDEHHIRPTTPKFRVSVPSLVPSSTVMYYVLCSQSSEKTNALTLRGTEHQASTRSTGQ